MVSCYDKVRKHTIAESRLIADDALCMHRISQQDKRKFGIILADHLLNIKEFYQKKVIEIKKKTVKERQESVDKEYQLIKRLASLKYNKPDFHRASLNENIDGLLNDLNKVCDEIDKLVKERPICLRLLAKTTEKEELPLALHRNIPAQSHRGKTINSLQKEIKEKIDIIKQLDTQLQQLEMKMYDEMREAEIQRYKQRTVFPQVVRTAMMAANPDKYREHVSGKTVQIWRRSTNKTSQENEG